MGTHEDRQTKALENIAMQLAQIKNALAMLAAAVQKLSPPTSGNL